ncbi:MAG: VWA domain-containing protein [Bacteroidota bacterium]
MINIYFNDPAFFGLLLLLPLAYIFVHHRRLKRITSITISTLQSVEGHSSLRGKLQILLPIFRALSFILLVIALARPQMIIEQQKISGEGIDIVLAMDLSSSMLAEDFEPNRLEASKKIAAEFVTNRPFDRIGLVAFAKEAFTQCPLTTDHNILQQFLANLTCGILTDGTAIGMGLATAINRLKDSEALSKVIILLTDGKESGTNYLSAETAMNIAKRFGIKIYAIGVGSKETARVPVRKEGSEYIFGWRTVEINEFLLQKIADGTAGKYYRATDEQDLQEIYAEINQLEKSEINITTSKRYIDKFHIFVAWGLLLLLMEAILKLTFLRSIP